MTTEPLDDPQLRARIERLRVDLDDGPAPTGPFEPDEEPLKADHEPPPESSTGGNP
jgi:hypothetical protein